MKSFFTKHILYVAWVQALIATCGSLFFSEVMHYPPCVLCWYQRICMYPLVLILGVGLLREKKDVVWYALPLAGVGWGYSLFHNLLYYNILPHALAPCQAGVSCTIKFFSWFGFVTIPLLSFIAFTVIILCLLGFWKANTKRTQ